VVREGRSRLTARVQNKASARRARGRLVFMLILTGLALAADPDVVWLQDGRILVDRQLLMEPVRGAWQPLLYPTHRPHASGDHRSLLLDISPSGQVLLVDDTHLLLGLFDGRLAASAPLPALPPDPSQSAAVWLDDRHILLAQRSDDGLSVCATLDAQTRAWGEAVDCPDAGLATIDRMARGPGPWMAVYSSEADVTDVQLVRWSTSGITRETLALEVTPAMLQVAQIELFFTKAGTRLLSTCDLLAEACTPGESLYYFEWLPSGELRPFRDDIRPGAVPSPGDPATFAWGEDGRVCIGDPSGERRCYPLPEG